jgi:hypothetical protein
VSSFLIVSGIHNEENSTKVIRSLRSQGAKVKSVLGTARRIRCLIGLVGVLTRQER